MGRIQLDGLESGAFGQCNVAASSQLDDVNGALMLSLSPSVCSLLIVIRASERLSVADRQRERERVRNAQRERERASERERECVHMLTQCAYCSGAVAREREQLARETALMLRNIARKRDASARVRHAVTHSSRDARLYVR